MAAHGLDLGGAMAIGTGIDTLLTLVQAILLVLLARSVFNLLMEYRPERKEPRWFIPAQHLDDSRVFLADEGYADVYHTKWAGIDVVVKEISQVELRRFQREVNTWISLRHENVVPLYGANHKKEPFFIVSKFASNGELVPYLKREKKDHDRTLIWRKMKEVAAGLFCLYQQNTVHGDLKGNNIVVGKDGTAMLTDFGMSFSEGGTCSVKKMKHTLGAMAWRAPEYAHLSVKKPTRKSGVYSLGMCIIEAATGANPWVGYTSEDVRTSLRAGKILVEKPEKLTNDQWALAQRLIALSPEARPEVPQILSELDKFADGEKMAED